jgi:hypothetical protein
VVNEFPDVFPGELPGMPPDRDIEFVIELKPSTTPIYKTPYRMATPELVKLKEHIKELLEKGFIHTYYVGSHECYQTPKSVPHNYKQRRLLLVLCPPTKLNSKIC